MRRFSLFMLAIFLFGAASWLVPTTLLYSAGPPETPTPTEGGYPEPTIVPQSATDIGLSASVRGGGSYRVGSWLPVAVTVQNDGPDFVGEVRISNAQGSAQYGTTIELPRSSHKSTTVYVRVDRFAHRLTVRLLRGGEQVIQQQITVDPHQMTDRFLAVATSSQGAFRLPPSVADGSKLVAIPLPLADFPEHVAGFSSFDALLLDEIALDGLSSPQMQTLHEWIARGGHVLLSGGRGADRTLAGLPEDLRPVTITGIQVANAADVLPAPPAGVGSLDVAQATPLPGTRPRSNLALGKQAGQPLLFERSLGRGSILFSSLRLNEPILAVWERSTTFWSDLLPARQVLPPGFGPSDVTPEQMIEGNIASSLTRLPALELPSLTSLGLLLLIYVLLAGPVTYLVLRKLDRQILGWIIIPALTVIFASVAYGIGYAQRGGDVVVNQFALIEPLGEGHARIRSFVGLFSPVHQQYAIELAGHELLRPISLQGPWDTSDQGGVFDTDRASELDVPQWTMRAVVADSIQPFDGLKATVTLDGQQLRGEVVNDTNQILRDVVIVQDVNVGKLGDLQPGEHKAITFGSATALELDARRAKFSGTPLSYMIYNELFEQQQGPKGGQPLPPLLQLRQGLLDAIYAIGPVQRNATPLLIAWADAPPVAANVPAQKITRQQMTMITLEPELAIQTEQLSLDQGWLQRGVEVDDPLQAQMICMGSKGLGMNLFGQTGIQTLTLPKPLWGFQAQELKLILSADGPWPSDVQLELYDWTASEWVQQTLNGQQPLTISEPAHFLGLQNGQIRARMSGQMNPQGGGCMYLDATVTGRMIPDA